MVNILNTGILVTGKLFSFASRTAGFGNGSTWPGHIALTLNKHFVHDLKAHNPNLKTILIAGTNGKTTTAKLIRSILEENKIGVIHNEGGANLLNGIASAFIGNSKVTGKLRGDYAVFEVDENSLPLVLQEMIPDYIILLDLFRDQLDRYGEVDTIARKWEDTISHLPSETTLILNADDPQIAYLGKNSKGHVLYFGLNDKSLATHAHQHAVDSVYCLNCGERLTYKTTYYSHIGDWECKYCGEKRPKVDLDKAPYYPLSGTYNRYNTNAAVLLSKTIGIDAKTIDSALQKFKPAFGRQEVIAINGKKIQIFLSKNPASFNQSLQTVKEMGGKHLLIILNDRIPDGQDVSWIWDIDFEEYLTDKMIVSVAGDRAYDMAIRLKYAAPVVKHVDTYFPLLDKGIESALEKVAKGETLYILPTYSAMLEVRKILTGKKIL